MDIDNQGVSSSKITGYAEASIRAKIVSYENYQDKDVVIIEGFVNDWYNEAPLGTYTDTTRDTVCGCLAICIEHILTQKPQMTIFVVLDHFGINKGGVDMSAKVLRNNITQLDYYTEVAKVCTLYGIPCVKEYEKSRMNSITDRYYLDYIHLNAIGAEQSANVIWDAMRAVTPSK